MRKIVGAGILFLVAVGALVWSQRRAGAFYVSGLIETEHVRVGSRVGGRVREVLIREGDRVRRGQVLVKLEPFDLQERLAEAKAVLAARKALLEKLQAGYRPEEIEQARARRDRYKAMLDRALAGKRPLEIRILEERLAVARAGLVNAESEYTRVKKLYDEGKAAQREMDEAARLLDRARAHFAQASDELELAKEGTRREDIAQARAALAEAEQALALVEKGYRSEEIAQAAAQVRAAQAAVETIQRQIDELTITAPCDCIVEAVDLQPGDLVQPSAPVVALIDPSKMWIRAYVPENRLALSIGQKVFVRVDSFPDRRFAGHVAFVSRQAEFTPSNVQTPEERSKQVFRIKVLLDEGLDVLRAGMSADVFLEPPS